VVKGRRTSPAHAPPSPATTAIADTGASGFYVTPSAPVINIDPTASKVTVGDAAGTLHRSLAQEDIQLNLSDCKASIMPTFQRNLLGIGKFCDKDCTVVFNKTAVTVFAKDGTFLLQGWREPD
jgi:hypothetical protein